MPRLVFTIGYAGKSLDELVTPLLEAGVDRVVDVRAVPISRKKGFSKKGLNEALGRAGIEYVHLRSAGNPYRDIKDDSQRCLALFGAHLDASPTVLDELQAAIEGHRAALLCVEADAHDCHRSVIADRLRRRDPQYEVRDL
jgi:uncharacterized protein (DUF488 family)